MYLLLYWLTSKKPLNVSQQRSSVWLHIPLFKMLRLELLLRSLKSLLRILQKRFLTQLCCCSACKKNMCPSPNNWVKAEHVCFLFGSQQIYAMLRFFVDLVVVFFAAPCFVFGLLRSLDLALNICNCRKPLRCIGLGLVALGALRGFGLTVGTAGRLFPPGQALKMWTSLTLRPLTSGGLAQVARTLRLTFSIHLNEEEQCRH